MFFWLASGSCLRLRRWRACRQRLDALFFHSTFGQREVCVEPACGPGSDALSLDSTLGQREVQVELAVFEETRLAVDERFFLHVHGAEHAVMEE